MCSTVHSNLWWFNTVYSQWNSNWPSNYSGSRHDKNKHSISYFDNLCILCHCTMEKRLSYSNVFRTDKDCDRMWVWDNLSLCCSDIHILKEIWYINNRVDWSIVFYNIALMWRNKIWYVPWFRNHKFMDWSSSCSIESPKCCYKRDIHRYRDSSSKDPCFC
jgi:hypothetical protein